MQEEEPYDDNNNLADSQNGEDYPGTLLDDQLRDEVGALRAFGQFSEEADYSEKSSKDESGISIGTGQSRKPGIRAVEDH